MSVCALRFMVKELRLIFHVPLNKPKPRSTTRPGSERSTVPQSPLHFMVDLTNKCERNTTVNYITTADVR